jgi:hypothetical protein
MTRNLLTWGVLTAISLTASGVTSLPSRAADADDPTASWTAPVVEKSSKPAASTAPTHYTPKVACNCRAQLPPDVPPPPKDPKKKQHKILKGIGKELGMEMGDLGKDMFLAFSVSGKDPYEMPKNPDIPYVYAEAQFIDGSSSHIYKYPDASFRVQGGYLDGTYACQQPTGEYIVQYPNGAQASMHMSPEGARIVRPDNTVTTMSHVGSGSFRVVNSKLGYIGDVTPDTTGLSYEFAKQDF